MEELVDGGQLLGRAVGLGVPVQGEQPADVFEGRPIVGRDEHPRGRTFTDFLKSPLLNFCSNMCVGWVFCIHLVSGQAEDYGGALTGPVDHQVKVRVIQMEHGTRKSCIKVQYNF